MNIFEAYLKNATGIFLVHLFLLTACAYCFVKEYLLLRRERTAFGALESNGFESDASGSEVAGLALLTAELSGKGQPPNADVLRRRVLGLLTPYESITHFCLNAFVVTGLLGTLYNLWRLGPQFWANLLKGSSAAARAAGQAGPAAQDVAMQVGQPAIGIAFAASVFGLSAALLISFLDSFFIRQPRESFASAAAAAIFAYAAGLIPPTEGAAVAKALDNFYRSSDSFLNKLRVDHEKLSAQFTKQVQDSSAELVGTLGKIGAEWKTLSESVAAEVKANQAGIGTRLSELAAAVSKTEETLAAALPSLVDAGKLAGTLDGLRLRASSLQAEIAAQFGEYSGKWRADLDQMTRTHVQQMESVYQKGWAQYSKESGDWHQKNVAALQGFADNVRASVKHWNEERAQAKKEVEDLLSDWRSKLSTALTGLGTGLADLNEQVSDLTRNSMALATSNDITLRHLRELQSAVASFNAEILTDTPLGRAIASLDAAVTELRGSVSGINVPSPPVYVPGGRDDEVAGEILKEVRRLGAAVEYLKAQGLAATPRTNHRDESEPPITYNPPEDSAPESWGARILRFLHLR